MSEPTDRDPIDVPGEETVDDHVVAPRGTAGLLSLVATPIGNLEDITIRALRTLREADLILAEDTRRTGNLCRHHGVGTRLTSFHAHAPPERVVRFVQQLEGGARLALVSDAGTPLVSDPGAELTRAAIAAGVRVESIPGASAPISALVSSGLAAPTFTFVGFLPRGGGKRTRALASMAKLPGAVILFEAPSRVGPTLRDLGVALGEKREAALCRELTKLHEEIARGPLAELAERFADGTLGEVTIVVGAPTTPLEEEPEEIDDARVLEWLAEGVGTKEVADRVAAAERGSRKDAYKRVAELAKRDRES